MINYLLLSAIVFYGCLSVLFHSFIVSLICLLGLLGLLIILMGGFIGLIRWQKNSFVFEDAWPHLTQHRLFFNQRLYALLLSTYTLIGTLFLSGMSISYDCLRYWQHLIPADTANYFALNIPQQSMEDLQAWLTQTNIRHSTTYPMIKGRLVQKNHQDIQIGLTKKQRSFNALYRALNLSYTTVLPKDNHIVTGTWPVQKNEWSVEESLASALNLHVGDVLDFRIGGQMVSGVISSIRRLSWQNLQPNFYVLGHADSLKNYPKDWILSFFLADPTHLASLIKRIPMINLIDLSVIIALVDSMVEVVVKLVSSFGWVALFSCVCLSIALYYGQKKQWQRLCLILHYFGLSTQSKSAPLYQLLIVVVGLSACVFTQFIYTGLAILQWLPIPRMSFIVQIATVLIMSFLLYYLCRIKVGKGVTRVS